MRLLLDQNLSRRILPFLQDAFPGSTQAALMGLETASDHAIWEAARAGGYVIVTQDADFADLGALRGSPPHIVWLRTGNVDKAAVLALLLQRRADLEHAFASGTTVAEVIPAMPRL